MYVRLIAQVSSRDEAQKMLAVLNARGVRAGVDSWGVVLTLTTESGCMPNTGMFHAADSAEVRAFARWALEAEVPLSVGVHGAALARDGEGPLPLSREMVEDLAREYGPAYFPMMHLMFLAAARNGELAELREQLVAACAAVAGTKQVEFGFTGLVSDLVRRTGDIRSRLEADIRERDRRIAELGEMLASATARAQEVAHQRNRAMRQIRRVRRVAR